MFWKKKADVKQPGSVPKSSGLFATLSQEEQISRLAVAIVACVSEEVRSNWYFARFSTVDTMGWTEQQAIDVAEAQVMRFSFVLFLDIHEDKSYLIDSDEEGHELLATLEKYRTLRQADQYLDDFLTTFTFDIGAGKAFINVQEVVTKALDLIHAMRVLDLQLIADQVDRFNSILVPEVLRALHLGTNRYGKTDATKVFAEIELFWSSLECRGDIRCLTHSELIQNTLDYILLKETDEAKAGTTEVPRSGLDFELWCAKTLDELGIASHLTQGGADQGIDLIAVVHGKRVGIQCKRYSSKVGNAAVQEALAGKSFYDLDEVCVVSTGGYTKSALDLSKRSNVVLLSDADVSRFPDFFLEQ